MSRYEIEILPNGKWRNMYPDYVVFSDHTTDGEHSCSDCKCSYCQDPSVFNIIHAINKNDGRRAGFMYCLDCLRKEHAKSLKNTKL
jgi:hypothetical protein